MGKAARAHFYQAITPLQKRCGDAMRRQARIAAKTLAAANDLPEDDTESDDPDAWDEARCNA